MKDRCAPMPETMKDDGRSKDAKAVLFALSGPWRRFFPSPVPTRLADDRRGVIIIMFALMLPVMLGFLGLAIEVALWYSNRRDMQGAADAAAIAAAYEIAESRTTNATARGTAEAENNGWSSSTGTIAINNSSADVNSTFPTSGAFTADSNAVEVLLTKNVTRLFSGYFFTDNTVTINGRAVATVVAGASTACVLALGSSNQQGALTVSGATNSVTMSGCTMATNSTNATAVKNQTGTMPADRIYSAGGVQGTPTPTACSGAKTNQPTVTDPFKEAGTTPTDADFDNCAIDGGTINTAVDLLISDGVYCSIKTTGGILSMGSGTYYIDKGDFSATGGGTVNASGVVIVFGDSTGSNNCGGLTISGSSNINITAPTSGNFVGIAFYRSSSCDANDDFNFTGTTASAIEGAVYTPSGDVSMTGTGTISGSCLQVVGDKVTFSGTGTLGSACDAFPGLPTILAGGIGQLVE